MKEGHPVLSCKDDKTGWPFLEIDIKSLIFTLIKILLVHFFIWSTKIPFIPFILTVYERNAMIATLF